MGRALVQAGTTRRLSHFGTLAFTRSRIETAFRGAHSQKHAALDPLGYAFALVWCAAAAFRLSCALTSVQQAALAVLAAATVAAAALQQLNAPAYLRHRSLILSALRLALAAASAAAQLLALQTGHGDSITAFILLQAGQYALLAFCAFAWRLRLQLHLPVQAACLAAVAAASCCLAAAVVTDPVAAAAVSGITAALSPTLAATLSPAAVVAAVTTMLQVQLGFHLPSSLLVGAESRERAAFLPHFLLQAAMHFQGGSFRLGRRCSSSPGPMFSPEVEARLAALSRLPGAQQPPGKP